MSEGVADYVACVRAQGAHLGQDRGQKLSASAAYEGTKAEVASDVRDALEKTYSASDANTLEVIRTCGTALGQKAPALSHYASYPGRDLDSTNIANLKANSPPDCSALCDAEPRCQAFVVGTGSWAGNCWLKGEPGKPMQWDLREHPGEDHTPRDSYCNRTRATCPTE